MSDALFKIAFLEKFNNYFNRKIIGYSEIQDYLDSVENYFVPEHTISFNPADNVSTEIIMNDCPFDPDYCILMDLENEIVSRWFVMETVFTRQGQRKFMLRRDVIFDNKENLMSSPVYVHKGWLKNDDPFILNDEGMSFNEIKVKERLLKDESAISWIVGYIARNTPATNIELQLNPEIAFPHKTLAEIAADIGTTEAKLVSILNIGEQNLNVARFTSDFILSFQQKSGRTDFIGQNDKIHLSSDLTAVTNYESSVFTGIGNELFYSGPVVVPSFGNKFASNIVTNRASVLSDLDSILSRPYFTKSQLEKLQEYADQETLVLYNGVYYRFQIQNSGEQVTKTGPAVYSTFGIIGTIIYNTSQESAYAGVTLRDSGPLTIQTQDTLSYVHLIDSRIDSGIKKLKTVISSSRKKLLDNTFDMFAIPVEKINLYTALLPPEENPSWIATPTKEGIALKIAIEIARELAGSCYDIQLLPYCPFPELIIANNWLYLSLLTEGEDFDYIKEVDGDDAEIKSSVILWGTSNKFSTVIRDLVFGDSNVKVENLIHKCRICSPNYQGSFDFSVAKNGNVVYNFIADCTYKPYTPYIKVAPQFSYLYGTNYGDCRGLICGGDFSISRLSDAWEQYELENKNYQNIFNREIQNLDFNQSLEHRKQLISGTIGVLTGGIGGAAGGAMASGSWIGAVVGGAAGTAAGAVGLGVDLDFLARQQRENKQFAIDKFNYQLGNIKALPYTLTKVGAFNINSKIWPFLEYYSCTEKEQEALERKLKYESMTVLRIDYFADYWRVDSELRYFKGELIRNEEIAEDNHIFEAIYAELLKGVFI